MTTEDTSTKAPDGLASQSPRSSSTPKRGVNVNKDGKQINKKKQMNGSAKYKQPVNTLTKMLSKVTVKQQDSPRTDGPNTKRVRSPASAQAHDNVRPTKQMRNASQASTSSQSQQQRHGGQNRSYSDIIAKITLSLKVFVCSDFSCVQWLQKITAQGIPNLKTRLVVLKHGEKLELAANVHTVRVVTCVPTRRDNAFILPAFANLNKNLNTEAWKITSRRHKGASKSTIFMRIDQLSYDVIIRQGGYLHWFLGTINVDMDTILPRPPNRRRM